MDHPRLHLSDWALWPVLFLFSSKVTRSRVSSSSLTLLPPLAHLSSIVRKLLFTPPSPSRPQEIFGLQGDLWTQPLQLFGIYLIIYHYPILLLLGRPPSFLDPKSRRRLSPVDESVPGLDISFAKGRDLFSFWLIFFCFLSIALLTATLPPEAARASWRARTSKSFFSAVYMPWVRTSSKQDWFAYTLLTTIALCPFSASLAPLFRIATMHRVPQFPSYPYWHYSPRFSQPTPTYPLPLAVLRVGHAAMTLTFSEHVWGSREVFWVRLSAILKESCIVRGICDWRIRLLLEGIADLGVSSRYH